MHIKKKWFVIPLAVGVLTLALTGGAILAHGGGKFGGPGSNDLAARVASILGLEEGQVQSAFNQVHREDQDAAMQNMLDRLVEAERIDQDLADAAMNWYVDRPGAALYLGPALFHNAERLQDHLDRLVADEVITEADAQAVLTWYENRPEGLDDLGIGGGHGGGHGRHHEGFRGGPGPMGPGGADDGTQSRFPQGFRSPALNQAASNPF